MGDSGLTGSQDHRRHLRRLGTSRRRRVSGKDPSKVDRSACYYARFIAKNIVAAGLANRCEVQVAYAIGVARLRSASTSPPSARVAKSPTTFRWRSWSAHFDCQSGR